MPINWKRFTPVLHTPESNRWPVVGHG